MSSWIVTWACTDFDGMAVFIEADSEQDAADAGVAALMELSDAPDHPSSLTVVPAGNARRWRAAYSMSPVPDEFQCCGGMPRLHVPGTDDEHCATCDRYVRPEGEPE